MEIREGQGLRDQLRPHGVRGETVHRAYALEYCTWANEQRKASIQLLSVNKHSSSSSTVESIAVYYSAIADVAVCYKALCAVFR